ncbi:uncharacterized protein METZ01_LOCUS142171, partial [marine metagenome]
VSDCEELVEILTENLLNQPQNTHLTLSECQPYSPPPCPICLKQLKFYTKLSIDEK